MYYVENGVFNQITKTVRNIHVLSKFYHMFSLRRSSAMLYNNLSCAGSTIDVVKMDHYNPVSPILPILSSLMYLCDQLLFAP